MSGRRKLERLYKMVDWYKRKLEIEEWGIESPQAPYVRAEIAALEWAIEIIKQHHGVLHDKP